MATLGKKYREQNRQCEYCPVLSSINRPPSVRSGLELEHIWGRRTKHHECWSNYAMACPKCHDYKTGTGSVLARIAITWQKMQKGEYDREELQKATGYDITGWVDMKLKTYPMPPQFKKFAEEIINGKASVRTRL